MSRKGVMNELLVRSLRPLLAALAFALIILAGLGGHAIAQAPVQVFYVPLPEADLVRTFQTIDFQDRVAPIDSLISVTIGSNGTMSRWRMKSGGLDYRLSNTG